MEHFCEQHHCAFKKYEKEGKVWYSHKKPEPEGGWCNEPKDTADAPKAPVVSKEAIKTSSPIVEPPKQKQETSSEDTKLRSMALSYAKDWCIAQNTFSLGTKLTYVNILDLALIFESYMKSGGKT